MNIILEDKAQHRQLWPLSFTRPSSELRLGILTLREKWENRISANYSWHTAAYLQGKFPLFISEQNLLVNACVCATDELAEQVKVLASGEGLRKGETLIVAHLNSKEVSFELNKLDVKWKEYQGELHVVENTWDIPELNTGELTRDFELLTRGRKSQVLSKTNQLLGDQLFIEEGAQLECAIINSKTGPVYIGKNAVVQEGSLIRGPFALCESSQVNMGSKIYGATTIGPHSKVGGEISQSVILAYSNKGHDGFLGHSVIGEWCNLGAGTNVSNLKNNYDKVRVWSYPTNRFAKTNLQFCGLIMGDHSKAGINTMFNTGTVVGLACNIHGTGFPRQFVPSFSDGGASGYKVHQLKAATSIAEKVMTRRNEKLTALDVEILQNVFELTSNYRKF